MIVDDEVAAKVPELVAMLMCDYPVLRHSIERDVHAHRFTQVQNLVDGDLYWLLNAKRIPGEGGHTYRTVRFPGIVTRAGDDITIWTSSSHEPLYLSAMPLIYGAYSMPKYQQLIQLARIHERDGNDERAYAVWMQARELESPDDRRSREAARARFAVVNPQIGPEWMPKLVKEKIEAAFAAVNLAAELSKEQIELTQPKDKLSDRLLAKVGLRRISKDTE